MIRKCLIALALLCLPLIAHAGDDPEHARLAALSGGWTVKQSLWLGGATTPKVDSGHADYAMVLGHHLQQNLTIDDGTDFHGLGTIGFDNAAGHYFSTWMDTNFPGLVVAWGDYDAASKSYTFTGSMDGGKVPVREVMTITDARHFTYDYYESHDGKEALTVRLEYSR